jgi:hypothetical protein
MWRPSRAQWLAIWTGFVVSALCFMNASPNPYARPKYGTIAWLVIAATILLVWFLQPRRPPK